MINQIKKFKNKRVLITGADGFMGSHLTEKLIEMGAKVSIFVRGNSINGTSQYNLKNLTNIKDNIQNIVTGNIGSSDSKKLILDIKPDYIFHLAAQSLVKKSYLKSKYTFETNSIGTLNLLEALKNYNSKR